MNPPKGGKKREIFPARRLIYLEIGEITLAVSDFQVSTFGGPGMADLEYQVMMDDVFGGIAPRSYPPHAPIVDLRAKRIAWTRGLLYSFDDEDSDVLQEVAISILQTVKTVKQLFILIPRDHQALAVIRQHFYWGGPFDLDIRAIIYGGDGHERRLFLVVKVVTLHPHDSGGTIAEFNVVDSELWPTSRLLKRA